jgi:hypothetical protein
MLKLLLSVSHLKMLRKEFASIKLECLLCSILFLVNLDVKVDRFKVFAVFVDKMLLVYKPLSFLTIIPINMTQLFNGKVMYSSNPLRHSTNFGTTKLIYQVMLPTTILPF